MRVREPRSGFPFLMRGLGNRPTQFMGEIAFLYGGAWSMALRAARHTRVLEVPREAMLTLMSRIPEMSDLIITVFSARRRQQRPLFATLHDRRDPPVAFACAV
jgi:thioredoxin reductase (NADPH)